MRPPRGTTFTVKFHNDAWRTEQWAVHWRVYLEGHTGRAPRKSAWFATEAEAEVFKQRTVAGIAASTPPPVPKPTTCRAIDSLAYFAENTWLPHVKDDNAGGTRRNYTYCFEHWIAPPEGHTRYPGLGNVVLSDTTFTKKLVKAWLAQLHTDKVSLSMRKRLLAALSACLGHAFDEEVLTLVNPCSKLGKTVAKKGERAIDPKPNPFAPDEIARIFDQLYAVEDLCWQVYALWQYHVGTRPGEAAAMPWTLVDLPLKRARVEWTYCPVDNIDKEPKTYECRDLDLTAELVTLLYKWRSVQAQEALRRGYPPPKYVFTTLQASRRAPRQLARILQSGTIRSVFARTMKACAIKGHVPYDFRDSFATSHLTMNWDKKLSWVSKQLGHSTPDTTKKHYYAYRDTLESRTFADEIGGFK